MIVVNSSQIKNAGNYILDKSNTLKDKIAEINDSLDKISVAWSGNKSVSYLNNMRSKYIVALKILTERINDCGEYLTKVPETYTTLDEDYGQKSIGV